MLDPLMPSFYDEFQKVAFPTSIGNAVQGIKNFAKPAVQAVQRTGQGEGMLAGPARFAQRTAHGIFGYQPKGGLSAVGGGSAETAKALSEAQQGTKPWHSFISGAEASVKPNEVARLQKAHQAMQHAEEIGATSIPGMAKAVMNHPQGLNKWDAAKDVIGTGAKYQWHSSGPIGKTMTVAAPLAIGAGNFTDPNQGWGEATGRTLVGAATSVSPLGIPSMMAADRVGGAVVGRAGRAADNLLTPRQPSIQPAPQVQGA